MQPTKEKIAARDLTKILYFILALTGLMFIPSILSAQCIGSSTSVSITRSIGCSYGTGSNATWDGTAGGTISDPGGSASDFNVTWTTSGTFRLKRTFPTQCGTTVIYSSYITIGAVASPTPTPNNRCGSGTVVLNGTPGSGGNTIKWYSAATGGSSLATATSYTTPSISTTTTYYITNYNSTTGCESSPRIAIAATINPIPSNPTPGSASRCV
ncbi:MAG: hypothetical protein ABI663_11515 [Chryseolinea sp.]